MLERIKKSYFLKQVGVSIKNNIFTFFYFKEDKTPEFFSIKMEGENEFLSILENAFGKRKNFNQYQWVVSIPPHYIWQKSIVFPDYIEKQERLQQALFLLESELPIALEDIWFDINEKFFVQSIRMDLFAIQQEKVKSYVNQFQPIKITVLDNKIYAIKRAFTYLIPSDIFSTECLEKSIFVYQDSQSVVVIAETAQQLIILEKISQKITALVAEFCQQYELLAAQVFLFQDDINQEDSYPENWFIVETPLPFIPLGNALWAKDKTVNKGK